MRPGLHTFLAAAAAMCLGGAALAQDDTTGTASETFDVQLNNAQENPDGSCRLVFLAKNQSQNSLEVTDIEVVIFDGDGRATRALLVRFDRMIPGKTRVVQFNLDQTGCDDISRILVNGVNKCQLSDGADSTFCFENLNLSALAPIEFGL